MTVTRWPGYIRFETRRFWLQVATIRGMVTIAAGRLPHAVIDHLEEEGG